MSTYEQDDGTGRWHRVARSQKIRCCDCGLVHVVTVRYRKDYLEYQAVRDNRATAASRRKRKR